MKLLHQHFKPEFLNRIDSIVFFKRLSEEDVKEITQIHLKQLEKRMAERDIKLKISKEAIDEIAKLGYSPEFGARPLKRAIQQHIIVPISREILKNPDKKEVSVGVKNNEIFVK